MKQTVLVALWLCCSFPTMVSGQLSLDACQEKALRNYPLIRQYDLIRHSETYSLSNATKRYLPQVSLLAKTSYQSEVTGIPEGLEQILSQMSGQEIAFASLSRAQYQLLAEVSQTLWDGGKLGAQKELIASTRETEERALEVDLYTLRERINQIFFGILSLNEQLLQLDILSQELQVNFEKISAWEQNGTANASDVDAIRVEQLKADQHRAEILAARKAFYAMLSLMTGDTLSPEQELLRPDFPEIPIQKENKRPELDWLQSQNQVLENQKTILMAENKPRLGLFAQGGYGNPGLNMLRPGGSSFYLVGARIQWSIGNLYTQKNTLRTLELNKQKIQTQKETFLLNSRMNVSQSDQEIDKIKQQLQQDDEIIALRKRIKNAAEAKVAHGTLSVSDLVKEINAENEAIQQKSAREIQLLKVLYQLKYTINQ